MISIFEDYPSFQPDILHYPEEIKFLEKVVGKQNLYVSLDGTIQVKHYVGFFQKGNFRLQVLPKLYL